MVVIFISEKKKIRDLKSFVIGETQIVLVLVNLANNFKFGIFALFRKLATLQQGLNRNLCESMTSQRKSSALQ